MYFILTKVEEAEVSNMGAGSIMCISNFLQEIKKLITSLGASENTQFVWRILSAAQIKMSYCSIDRKTQVAEK